MHTVSPGSWPGLLVFVAAACNAVAAEPMVRTATPAVMTTEAAATAVPRPYVDGLGRSVGANALAQSSGGTEITQHMTLNGTVSDNSADHVLTGPNAISTGSFSGAAGLPMVIQNTGNNVLIQNATIINVQFQP